MAKFDQIIALSLAQPKSTEQFTRKKTSRQEKGPCLTRFVLKALKM